MLQHVSPITQGCPSGIHFRVVVVLGAGVVVGAAVVVGALVVVGATVVVGALVVVGLVEKHVLGFGSRQLSVPPHPPQQEQGLLAIALASAEPGVTHFVTAAPRRQVPSALRGTSQTLTLPSPQVTAAIARAGISAARAVPAKSFSARRRLIDPSATARASSSNERLVSSLLTCGPFPQGVGLGD